MSQLIEFAQDGRKKVIERRMTMHCHVCSASLPCPEGADFWVWVVGEQVRVFKQLHLAHGNERTVGAQITEVEKA